MEIGEDTEPKTSVTMQNEEGECIVYTQTIVPNTMRSTYWKYFGFPGNDNHEILTKNRVVCTICNKVISYNKNTSNLRTHLVAKHPEKLFGLNNFNQSDSSVNSPKLGKTKKLSGKKESQDSGEISFEVLESYIPDQESFKKDYDKIPVLSYEVVEDEVEKVSIGTMTEGEISCNLEQVSCSNQLLDVVIKDLVDPSCFSGSEFKRFLSRNGLKVHELEKEFEEYCCSLEYSPMGQFSLGLEFFNNCEGSTFLSVYTTILKETALETKLFTIVKFEGSTTLEELLTKIDLKNCSAVVLSSDSPEPDLESFFTKLNVPVIWCLHSILKSIVDKVFQIEEVNNLLKELAFSSNEQVPTNPWKKYQKLSSWKSISSRASSIVKILNQLELTLDVLSEEPLQVCSLLKPLSDQLMVFLPEEGEFSNISDFIRDELKTALQQNDFLTMACFFDPRFQSSLSEEDLSSANLHISSYLSSESQNIEIKEEITKPERKSGLKMFFNRGKTSSESSQPKVRKTNLSVELSKYSTETPLDVEFCPLDWWKENNQKYKLLSKLSNKYFCVPCFYRSDVKLKVNGIVDLDERRFYLRDKHFIKILLLHNGK
ncbi:hypothetical protein ACFFRR_006574 [Megaselia abdita]